jgi:hypothetical protein
LLKRGHLLTLNAAYIRKFISLAYVNMSHVGEISSLFIPFIYKT